MNLDLHLLATAVAVLFSAFTGVLNWAYKAEVKVYSAKLETINAKLDGFKTESKLELELINAKLDGLRTGFKLELSQATQQFYDRIDSKYVRKESPRRPQRKAA